MIKPYETFIEKLFLLSAIISIAITILIFGFMLILGFPLIKEGHFFDLLTQPWKPYHGSYGIYPMIVGTLSISFLSLIFAIPISLGCASFIRIFGTKRLGQFLKKVVQLMTGVPTVIYGFVGVFLLVPIIRGFFQKGSGMCVLSAALMLSVLVAPTMILIFSDSFDQVPSSYLDAVDALSGNRVQKFLYIILPCAKRGVLTGIILGLGRAMGDTLIALMIAGNAIQVPGSVLDSARTLTSHIALIIAADYESLEFKSIFVSGILLYLFTTVIVLAVRSIENRKGRQTT